MAFVRVDAPLRQGGAGQSLLVESHRSILCPSWDPCTFVLEPTLTVAEFASRKLPKWRELTTEEILSTKDRELLKLDRVETGPRYHVWTLTNNAALSASASDWTGLWDPAEEEVPPDHLAEAEKGCMQRNASALLLPLRSPDRPLYVIAERGGLITLWDLRHRCAWQSFRVSAEASPRRRSLVSGRRGGVSRLRPLSGCGLQLWGQGRQGLREQQAAEATSQSQGAFQVERCFFSSSKFEVSALSVCSSCSSLR